MTTVTEVDRSDKLSQESDTERILGALRQVYREIKVTQQRIERLEAASNLGFGHAPVTRTIHCKRKENINWYIWNGPEGVEPIFETAITGYARSLTVKQGEYKGEPTYNLQLLLDCGDRQFVLDAGFKSQFSKGLMASLSVTPAHDLKQPVTISVRPGTQDEKVLLCTLWSAGQPVRHELPEQPDWNAVFSTAAANVSRANQ